MTLCPPAGAFFGLFKGILKYLCTLHFVIAESRAKFIINNNSFYNVVLDKICQLKKK